MTHATAKISFKSLNKEGNLSCPAAKTNSWGGHPRVFLNLTRTGFAQCPYCGAHYRLEESSALPSKKKV